MIPKQTLFYENVDDTLVPYWYVLNFNHCNLNWDEQDISFELIKPFDYIGRDYFDDNLLTALIYSDDIVTNSLSTGRARLNLSKIKTRLELIGTDPCLYKQFVMSNPDIHTIIPNLPTQRVTNFVLHN